MPTCGLILLFMGWFLLVAGPVFFWINRRILCGEGYEGWELWRRVFNPFCSRAWVKSSLSEENRGLWRAFKAILKMTIYCFALVLTLALLVKLPHESQVLVYWPMAIYIIWTVLFVIPTLKVFDYKILKNEGPSGTKLWLPIFIVVPIKRWRKGPVSDQERGLLKAFTVMGMVSMSYYCLAIFLLTWWVSL